MRVWPTQLQDCLLNERHATELEVYCNQTELQAARKRTIGHEDDESRTCLVVEKPRASTHHPKPRPVQKNTHDETPPSNNQEHNPKTTEEENPFKAPHKKSSTPAATGWAVALALPVFLAVHTTAGALHSSN
mmetsp:Transcript_63832/g.126290  ORF Transcript_63832/g.126290 Transcript_63832/m.126290 type:complete len:132 (-) Transcript_63832:64-459(-)